MPNRHNRGFILPLAVLLVVILAISGMSFMHHDFLERRMAGNTADNHAAFYLANAGIERARATLKPAIDPDGNPFWTPLLNEDETEDGSYVLVDPPDLLCDGHSPCLRPPMPFGPVVVAPSSTPLAFDRGQYAVRVFNNDGEVSPSEDTDGTLTVRAEGIVGGERKLLQADIRASSGLRMVNCDENFIPNDEDCPHQGSVTMDPLLGREPASFDPEQLPKIQSGFYNNPGSFPLGWGLDSQEITAPPGVRIEFRSAPPQLNPPPNTYYFENDTHYIINGDVNLNGSADNIVMFVTGSIKVTVFESKIDLVHGDDRGSILIAQGGIILDGTLILDAPLPFPALVSENGIISNTTSGVIQGNIWSSGGPTGLNLDVQNLEGIIIGVNGLININADTVRDHDNDEPDIDYYVPMPGFDYPEELSTGIVKGTWRELE